jgi:hypothetical protein
MEQTEETAALVAVELLIRRRGGLPYLLATHQQQYGEIMGETGLTLRHVLLMLAIVALVAEDLQR